LPGSSSAGGGGPAIGSITAEGDPPSGNAGTGLGAKLLGGAMIASVVFGRGSPTEKAQTLAVGYGLTKTIGFFATGAIGTGLGFAVSLCGDQGGACEAQAKAKMMQDFNEEINTRAADYLMTHPDASMPFVREKMLDAKYKELGLDKAAAAQEQFLKEVYGDPNPNVCSKYGPARGPLKIDPVPIIYNSGPSMSAR
ncbi:MAG TPA: hypothetical protein VI756_16675, partial [Blastocatellia bacterium]